MLLFPVVRGRRVSRYLPCCKASVWDPPSLPADASSLNGGGVRRVVPRAWVPLGTTAVNRKYKRVMLHYAPIKTAAAVVETYLCRPLRGADGMVLSRSPTAINGVIKERCTVTRLLSFNFSTIVPIGRGSEVN